MKSSCWGKPENRGKPGQTDVSHISPAPERGNGGNGGNGDSLSSHVRTGAVMGVPSENFCESIALIQ